MLTYFYTYIPTHTYLYTYIQEILNDTATARKSITDPCLLDFSYKSICINEQLFEKYRIKYIKTLLLKYIHSHLKYYCKGVEEFSSALQLLQSLD